MSTYWDSATTAAYLGFTAKTLYDLNYKNTGPPYRRRPGCRCEYLSADVKAWKVAHDLDLEELRAR